MLSIFGSNWLIFCLKYLNLAMLVVVKLNHWYLYIKSESGTGLYDGLIVVDDGFRKAYAEKKTLMAYYALYY